MSDENKDITRGHTVIAIARDEGKYKAVCLSKKKGAVQVLWSKSADSSIEDWTSFAAKCGIDVKQRQAKNTTGRTMVVAGFSSVGVVFYRLKVPSVKSDEMEHIIRLQTESRLPLSGEQIEISYRTGDSLNGQTPVTVAAAKRENLQRFIQNVQPVKPEKIILDCEAIVKTWSKLFDSQQQQVVVIDIGQRASQVCLVESGRMTNASVVDIGTMDFPEKIDAEQAALTADRFVQDIRGTLELFGFTGAGQVPVYVLSYGDGQENNGTDIGNRVSLIKEIVNRLRLSAINAQVSDFRFPVSKYQLVSDDWASVYEHRVPVGLGLIALDADNELDIFGRLYKPADEGKKKHWLFSLKTASIVTVMMAVLAVLMFYFLDVASLRYYDSLDAKSQTNYNAVIEKQELMETVAEYRPDILGLLSQISSVEANGIMLSSFDFKRGQTIKIKGTATGSDRIYKFQEDIGALKDIKNVVISASTQDEKTKRIEFTISFHYKNFTK
jgi:hypothetical protein